MPEEKSEIKGELLRVESARAEQTWKLKLFTKLGDDVLLDIGELLALEIEGQLLPATEPSQYKTFESGKCRVIAVMTGNIRLSLTCWFDSERQARALMSEYQTVIAKRIRNYFRPYFGFPYRDQEQARRDAEAIEKGGEIEV